MWNGASAATFVPRVHVLVDINNSCIIVCMSFGAELVELSCES